MATEKWIMKGGYLRIEGESKGTEEDALEAKSEEKVIYDGAGNKVEVKKALSEKDAEMHFPGHLILKTYLYL